MTKKNNKNLEDLIGFINESIDSFVFKEQDEENKVSNIQEPSSDLQDTDSSDMLAGDTTDTSTSLPSSSGSNLGGSGAGDISSPDMTDDMGMSGGGSSGANGMSSFSGNFGGGGGGGGGLDTGGEQGEPGTEENEPSEPSYNPFESAKSLEDRLQVVLNSATELADKTQDPQKVLKHVKGLIQNGFEEPEKAAKVISDLFGTKNPVLQQVSRRLALFTYGI